MINIEVVLKEDWEEVEQKDVINRKQRTKVKREKINNEGAHQSCACFCVECNGMHESPGTSLYKKTPQLAGYEPQCGGRNS